MHKIPLIKLHYLLLIVFTFFFIKDHHLYYQWNTFIHWYTHTFLRVQRCECNIFRAHTCYNVQFCELPMSVSPRLVHMPRAYKLLTKKYCTIFFTLCTLAGWRTHQNILYYFQFSFVFCRDRTIQLLLCLSVASNLIYLISCECNTRHIYLFLIIDK